MFKTCLFFCFALLFATALTAQTAPKRFQFGVNYSADYAFRTLKQSDNDPYTKLEFDRRNERESAKYGFTTGLNVLFALTDHLEIGAGVQYSNKGYRIPDLSAGSILPYYPSYDSKLIFSLNYLDIPLKVNYLFGKGKWRGMAGAGVVANFRLGATVKSVIVHNGDRSWVKGSDEDKYGKFNLSPMLSAGVAYQLNERMHVRLEPTFRYGVLKVSDSPITMRLWDLGLNAGFYFSL